MKLPLGKPYLKKEIIMPEIEKVIDSRWISGGPAITRFENEVQKYNNDTDGYYTTVCNCTVALEMMLEYLNCTHKEDEVIVPSWSWIASGMCVYNVGATPVFCDVNKFGVPSVETIEPLINSRTKAIIIVHQMGIPCDMDKINELAKQYSLPIIEDAACGFGAEYKGTKIGKSPNLVTYSFQARKVLTTGEGGMIITRDSQANDWFKKKKAFGTSSVPLERAETKSLIGEQMIMPATNRRISDLQCALGLAHLKYVDEEIELRNKAANLYKKYLSQVPGVVWIQEVPEYCTRYNWQSLHFALEKNINRNKVLQHLKENDIGCRWDIPAMHLEPCWGGKYLNIRLPQTMYFHNFGVWPPFYAEITEEEIAYVAKVLSEGIKK